MKKTLAATAVCVGAAALLAPGSVFAQTQDAWRFDASLYVYLPTISGSTTFPQNGSGGNVNVDSSKILDSLKMMFMGSLEARRGVWGVFTDVVYVDLGQSKSGFRDFAIGGNPLPGGASADARYDLQGVSWTLAGSYRAVPDPSAPVDFIAGARMLDIKQTFGWQVSGNVGSIPLPGRGGNLEAKLRNWDAIVGVKGRWAFGNERRWFVPYYLDIGTGESDLTWQAMTGVGYSFGWGDVVGSWRYLDYKMKSGSNIEKLNFSGPSVAAVFHW